MASDGSPSGLTPSEAQEVHKFFVSGFIGFTLIAIVAHALVFMWRPWPTNLSADAASLEATQNLASAVIGLLG